MAKSALLEIFCRSPTQDAIGQRLTAFCEKIAALRPGYGPDPNRRMYWENMKKKSGTAGINGIGIRMDRQILPDLFADSKGIRTLERDCFNRWRIGMQVS